MTSRSGVAQARYIYIYVLLHTNVIKKKRTFIFYQCRLKVQNLYKKKNVEKINN